jgi:hypothetical protein
MSAVDTMHAAFSTPPAIWRDAPFWSWNAELAPDRLCRQIAEMQAAGFGGFFMHSRYGLKTPYLSEEWFACITACIEQARALGMKAYLYDEDRWPSGAAAGSITRARPELRRRFIRCATEQPFADAEWLAGFRIRTDTDGRLATYAPASRGAADTGYWLCHEQPSAWFNGGTYIDTMDAEATAAFIASTHDLYAERYGDDFGGVVPAIFIDEYYLARGRSADEMPWTRHLQRVFAERWHYDLVAHLPALFFEPADDEFSTVRYHYLRTLTDLFVHHFTRPIGEWCDAHGIALTGHLLEEETLSRQCPTIGAAMPHYPHMQWPGIDVLGDAGRDKLVMTKQCTSVADQLDKDRCLSELYGGVGWDWPLAGHKYVGDWHAVLGINFRCVHLVHYSLAGGAKRDWLPSQSAHSPWWPCYRQVEDYFGRLNFMLAQGMPCRDILVIHPIDSAWGCYQPRDLWVEDRVATLGYSLHNLCETLSDQHRDWDFGDESVMAEHARVDNDRLVVGRLAYALVIVPPCLSLRQSTLDLLNAFVDNGGRLLFVGERPTRLDGVASMVPAALAARALQCAESANAVIAAVDAAVARTVSVVEDGAEATCCWTMLRQLDDGLLLFVHSHDRAESHSVMVTVAGAAAPVVRWDLETGAQQTLSVADDSAVPITLPPAGSALLTFGRACPAAEPTSARATAPAGDTLTLPGPWPISLSEANTMPLDFCTYSLADEPFSALMPVLQADREMRARYGESPRLGQAEQPWYLASRGAGEAMARQTLVMRWEFHVTDRPVDCRLAVENRDAFDLTVNENAAGPADVFWVDEDLTTVDITSLLCEGENVITARVAYGTDIELENLILVGAFGVTRRDPVHGRKAANYTLVSAPETLTAGSWVDRGLDFYTGSVRYQLSLPEAGRWRIALPALACTAAAIRADDKMYPLPWPPYEADVNTADGVIEVELFGGRRNTLGGNHVPGAGARGESFDPVHPHWDDAYILTDHGLTGPVHATRIDW